MPVNEEKTIASMKAHDDYDVWARKCAGGSDAFKELWNKAHGIAKRRGRPRKQDSESDADSGDES